MSGLRKFWKVFEQICTLYLPIASFLLMFCVFIWQIFARYVLRNPPPWAFELSFITYICLVMTGACYATRMKSHVVFTLIYEKFPLRIRAMLSFVGNLLMVVAFTLSVPATVEYVFSMKRQETSALHIGLNWVYAPYLIFLFFTLVYFIKEMVEDVLVFTGRASQALLEEFSDEQKKDYEVAIEQALEGGEDE